MSTNTTDIALMRLESKLDKLALDQLRRVAAALYEELETTKDRLAWAEQEAELCRQERDMLHEAMADDNFATHRKVGINQQGEMLIVQMEH